MIPQPARAVLACALLACSDGAMVVAPPRTPPPSPPPAQPIPPIPGDLYVELGAVYERALGHHVVSRIILEDGGGLAIDFLYPEAGGWTRYSGSYQRRGDMFAFSFPVGRAQAPWEATATIAGDTIVVRYDWIMLQDGFIDARYLKAGRAP